MDQNTSVTVPFSTFPSLCILIVGKKTRRTCYQLEIRNKEISMATTRTGKFQYDILISLVQHMSKYVKLRFAAMKLLENIIKDKRTGSIFRISILCSV